MAALVVMIRLVEGLSLMAWMASPSAPVTAPLTVIAADKNSTIVFPLPVDLLGPLLEHLGRRPPPA